MTLTFGILLAVLVVFGFAWLIYFLSGKFGAPAPVQRIIGIICLVLWLLYALNRTGLLSGGGSIQL